VAGSIILLATVVLALRVELRSEIRGVERGGDATCGLAMGAKIGVVLVLRRGVGSSCLSGGVRGGRCLGSGSCLHSSFGTAAATSSVTGAVLVCACW
jgi:hypothetical protein